MNALNDCKNISSINARGAEAYEYTGILLTQSLGTHRLKVYKRPEAETQLWGSPYPDTTSAL